MAINNAINSSCTENWWEYRAGGLVINDSIKVYDSIISLINSGDLDIFSDGEEKSVTMTSDYGSGATFQYELTAATGEIRIISQSTASGGYGLHGTAIGSRTFTFGGRAYETTGYLGYGTALDTQIMVFQTSAANKYILTLPLQPAFNAYNSSDDLNVTGASTYVTVDVDTERFDQNGDFSGDTFTSSVTGKYYLQGTIKVFDFTAATVFEIDIVTSNIEYKRIIGSPTTLKDGVDGEVIFNVSALCDMDAADTAVFKVVTSGEAGNTNDVGGDATTLETYFSGYLAQ